MDLDELIQYLEREVVGAGSETPRIAAIRMLAIRADARAVPVLLALATPASPVVSRPLADAFRDAMARTLRMSPGATPSLRPAVAGLPPKLAHGVIEAAGRADRNAAIDLLGDMLTSREDLAGIAIPELERLLRRSRPIRREIVGEGLRARLESRRTAVRQAAASALGALRDEEFVPDLIELLADESAGVRSNAHRSLVEITGLAFRADCQRWRDWREAEVLWLKRDAPAVLARLDSKQPEVVVGALREIVKHRTGRDRLVARVARVVERSETGLAMQACETLAQLGSPAAIPVLLDGLERGGKQVRVAAWSALVTLTGRDLPLDHEACRKALEAD
jgi:HEAT repeat protein